MRDSDIDSLSADGAQEHELLVATVAGRDLVEVFPPDLYAEPTFPLRASILAIEQQAAAAERDRIAAALASADHIWSQANGRVRCASHYLPVRPCTPADHEEWATAILAAIGQPEGER